MYYKTLYMNIKFYDAYGKILSKFEEHNIQHIPLKGIYLAEWLYKDIGLRLLSDIDLLVKVSDGQKCIQLLMELGYKYEHQPVVSALVDMDCQAHYNRKD